MMAMSRKNSKKMSPSERKGRVLGALMLALTAAVTYLWWTDGISDYQPEGSYFGYSIFTPFMLWGSWRMAMPKWGRHRFITFMSGACTTTVWLAGFAALFGAAPGSGPWLVTAQALWLVLMGFGAFRVRRLTKPFIPSVGSDLAESYAELEARLVRSTIDRPSGPGQMTGYEPKDLFNLPVPTGRYMHGTPGSGLSESGFGEAAVQTGQAGELNFAKSLDKAGLLDRYTSFWSVAMPNERGFRDEEFSSDIDCVLVSGKTIWLLDMKQYVQGDVTWKTEGSMATCVDNQTGSQVGPKRKMSKNMAMARDRFKAAYPGYEVLTLVVFMPGAGGMGKIEAWWPGNVRAYSLPMVLGLLQMEAKGPDGGAAAMNIKRLVKG